MRAPSDGESFLFEMAKNGLLDIRVDEGGKLVPCLKCPSGIITERSGAYGAFDDCGSRDFKRNLLCVVAR